MKQRILCVAVAAAMAFSAAGCSGSSSSSASSQTLSTGDYTGTVSAISESSITLSTDAKGGAGVFVYGDGVATVSDSTITTTQDTSGGIHVAGGGALYASNLTVETSGSSSAAIRSDRGSGTMVVNGSTLTGAFVDDESNAGTGGSGYASLTVEGGSAWVVTGNSVLTDLANVSQIVDSQGRTVTIQSADGTIYVQGTSDVTVTVSSYTTQIDTIGTSTADSWSSYAAA